MIRTHSLLLMTTFAFNFASSHSAQAKTAQDVKKKAKETVETAVEYSKEQKEAFTEEMEKNLTQMRAKITELRKKSGNKTNATLARLESQQNDLEKDIHQLKKASGQAWGRIKSGVSKAWQDVKTSVEEAKDEFK
jgi:TolA-binding protein